MNSNHKIAAAMVAAGYTIQTELGKRSALIAYDKDGDTAAIARFLSGRFTGGCTVDRMGHVTSHDTVTGLIESIERYGKAA